jgi:hypothetical protein
MKPPRRGGTGMEPDGRPRSWCIRITPTCVYETMLSRQKVACISLVVVAAAAVLIPVAHMILRGQRIASFADVPPGQGHSRYAPRQELNIGGFGNIVAFVEPWRRDASLSEIATAWTGAAERGIRLIDEQLSRRGSAANVEQLLLVKSQLCHYLGKPRRAYEALVELRSHIEQDESAHRGRWATIVFMQGVTGLRIGETENCVACRGESSCILPVAPEARHRVPDGSQLAIRHFREYLAEFPDDLEARWLLNLAHMTLGTYPAGVEPRWLISLERFRNPDHAIGRFREISSEVGFDRFDQAGGTIMEDFDNDGLLDLVVSTMDLTQAMGLFRNRGDGSFRDCSDAYGLSTQLGGLYCVQGDYNNDGFMDVYIPRGAWLQRPVRPTLLRNDGDGGFTDVTSAVGLLEPVNSISAAWADYDGDGALDLFVCCEQGPSRLYRNAGDDSFEEVSAAAGIELGLGAICKGAAWIDMDNDDAPDLFVTLQNGPGRLFRNLGDGRFRDVSRQSGIDGPNHGFSCWAWDYNNDGRLDLFATSYDRTTADVVRGLLGQPHHRHTSRLFQNRGNGRFEDATARAGLDLVFATMGSNFADFDGDGWLDMYLGTGDPSLSTLVPNRMFRNVAGNRFADITGSSGTGHLQKGHSVACGDWDRDGNVDLCVQTGGALDGDRYHNLLFQNPGHDAAWLTIRLAGNASNRAAIGARISVLTAGAAPLTVHRHITSGSSFGANPLELTIGLGDADEVAELTIHWPVSGATQVFRHVAVNQIIRIAEGDQQYNPLPAQRVVRPNRSAGPPATPGPAAPANRNPERQ